MIEPAADILKVNIHFNKPEKYIGPGEFYASRDDVVISTLLGSCISVALYDPVLKIGGLNHFMLPFPRAVTGEIVSTNAKYGVNAMEVLINDILKKGGQKSKLKAKVFGGSAVLDYHKEATYNIPKMNISFAFEFLDTEKIPVESYSVGGTRPRKIFFFPMEARILMKYSKSSSPGLAKRESQYSQILMEQTANAGKHILF